MNKVATNNKIIDLWFLTLAISYLNLAKNIFQESIKCENKNTLDISYMNEKEIKEACKEFDLLTKRNDVKIIIPTLFLFYHGIEILLKWILSLNKETVEKNHLIVNPYQIVSKKYPTIKILEKYIKKESLIQPLKSFIDENNVGIDNFYEYLRYPINQKETKIFRYWNLKYHEEKGLDFMKQVISDIEKIVPWSVRLYRSKEKKSQE